MKKKIFSTLFCTCIVAALLLAASACAGDTGNVQTTPAAVVPTQTPVPTSPVQPTEVPTEVPTQMPTEVPTPAPTPKIEIISEESVTVQFFNETAVAIKKPQMLTESIAIQFYATAPFDSLQLTCPSWSDAVGTLIFDLYKWEGSYRHMFTNTAATQEFANYPDNNENVMTFSELPAGEYVLYLTSPDPSEAVGCYLADEPDEGIAIYLDDVFQEGQSVTYFSVHYTKTPDIQQGAVHPEG